MSKTRLFRIEWDNTKVSPRLAAGFREEKRHAEGTHYARGTISLDNGVHFDSLSEFKDHFEQHGNMKMFYQDEQVAPGRKISRIFR